MEERLANWIQWKQRCAVDRCEPIARHDLRRYAGKRFRRLVPREVPYGHDMVSAGLITDETAWHLFETHLVGKFTRGGVRYKDWLFARVERSDDDPLDVVQGGASLIIRTVVRRHIRDEWMRRDTVSLQTVVADGGNVPLMLQDLLPVGIDPAEEAARREYEDLAATHAAQLFSETTERERFALLAKALHLSLATPALTAAAACGRASMNTAYQGVVRRMAAAIHRDYADESVQAAMHLALRTIEEAKKQAVQWGKLEKRCRRLFLIVEDDGAGWADSVALEEGSGHGIA